MTARTGTAWAGQEQRAYCGREKRADTAARCAASSAAASLWAPSSGTVVRAPRAERGRGAPRLARGGGGFVHRRRRAHEKGRSVKTEAPSGFLHGHRLSSLYRAARLRKTAGQINENSWFSSSNTPGGLGGSAPQCAKRRKMVRACGASAFRAKRAWGRVHARRACPLSVTSPGSEKWFSIEWESQGWFQSRS